MSAADKIREDIGPEDFSVPAEYAERARLYANWLTTRAIAPPVAAGSVEWCKEVNMDGLREENAELRQRAEKAEADLETWVHTNRIDELQRELAHKQAIIDRLMLEYCPGEMTVEQTAEWASHQKRTE